jgi:hypothetical protein
VPTLGRATSPAPAGCGAGWAPSTAGSCERDQDGGRGNQAQQHRLGHQEVSQRPPDQVWRRRRRGRPAARRCDVLGRRSGRRAQHTEYQQRGDRGETDSGMAEARNRHDGRCPPRIALRRRPAARRQRLGGDGRTLTPAMPSCATMPTSLPRGGARQLAEPLAVPAAAGACSLQRSTPYRHSPRHRSTSRAGYQPGDGSPRRGPVPVQQRPTPVGADSSSDVSAGRPGRSGDSGTVQPPLWRTLATDAAMDRARAKILSATTSYGATVPPCARPARRRRPGGRRPAPADPDSWASRRSGPIRTARKDQQDQMHDGTSQPGCWRTRR